GGGFRADLRAEREGVPSREQQSRQSRALTAGDLLVQQKPWLRDASQLYGVAAGCGYHVPLVEQARACTGGIAARPAAQQRGVHKGDVRGPLRSDRKGFLTAAGIAGYRRNNGANVMVRLLLRRSTMWSLRGQP